MTYFIETSDTIPAGLGFSLFGGIHCMWLAILVITVIANSILYRKLSPKGQDRWQKIVAFLIFLDEMWKVMWLIIGGNYSVSYLPLHLCSINIFLILLHCFKPSKTLDNFLYTVCIPGALAAALFPTWTKLPVANFMHLHSSTVHILLVLYPAVLAINGKLKISWKAIPRCLGLLVLMAIQSLVGHKLYVFDVCQIGKSTILVWSELGKSPVGIPCADYGNYAGYVWPAGIDSALEKTKNSITLNRTSGAATRQRRLRIYS